MLSALPEKGSCLKMKAVREGPFSMVYYRQVGSSCQNTMEMALLHTPANQADQAEENASRRSPNIMGLRVYSGTRKESGGP